MVDGIYKLTLKRTKNAIYSTFSYIFAIKKAPGQLEYDTKYDTKSKMSRNIMKKVKNFFIDAVCAHSGPEYFFRAYII